MVNRRAFMCGSLATALAMPVAGTGEVVGAGEALSVSRRASKPGACTAVSHLTPARSLPGASRRCSTRANTTRSSSPRRLPQTRSWRSILMPDADGLFSNRLAAY